MCKNVLNLLVLLLVMAAESTMKVKIYVLTFLVSLVFISIVQAGDCETCSGFVDWPPVSTAWPCTNTVESRTLGSCVASQGGSCFVESLYTIRGIIYDQTASEVRRQICLAGYSFCVLACMASGYDEYYCSGIVCATSRNECLDVACVIEDMLYSYQQTGCID
jgi:hypothetical protein